MVDFTGFDQGVIGKPLPADSTLNNMKKYELIGLLHLAESNHKVLAGAYANAVNTSKCNRCPLMQAAKNEVRRCGLTDSTS